MKNTNQTPYSENGVWIGPNKQSGTDGENRENTKNTKNILENEKSIAFTRNLLKSVFLVFEKLVFSHAKTAPQHPL